MKKFNYILAMVVVAFLASCGNSTETKATDSPAATSTETTTPASTETQTPAATEGSDVKTSVEVNKDGAKVQTEKTGVDANKDGVKVEIKK